MQARPAPAGCRRSSSPSSAWTRSARPRRPEPREGRRRRRRRRRSRRPRCRSCAATLTCDARGARVLGDVGERLADEEVGRRLGRRGSRVSGTSAIVDRHGRAVGERAERRTEAVLGQDRRVDPARELAQLVERGTQLARRPRRAARTRRSPPHRACARASCSTSPIASSRCWAPSWRSRSSRRRSSSPARDDPRPRLPQLRELGPQLGLKALVLEREPRRRAGRLRAARVARAALGRGRAPRPARRRAEHVTARPDPGAGSTNGRPVRVHVGTAVRQPERELERRIAQRRAPARRAPTRGACAPARRPGRRPLPRALAAPEHPTGQRERERRGSAAVRDQN